MSSRKVKSPIQRVVKEDKPDINNLINSYVFDTILPGSGQMIIFKAMTTLHIKQLLAHEGEENPRIVAKAMRDIIRDCVVDKEFNVDEMLLKDRSYLLLQMRNKTKGNKWDATYECEKCKSQNLIHVDLNQLEITTLDPMNMDGSVEPLEGLKLKLRLLRVEDEENAFSVVKGDLTKSKIQAELIIVMYANTIEEITHKGVVYENLSLEDKVHFIEGMPTGVYEEIVKWHDEYNYGVDFDIKHKCFSCKNEITIDVSPDNFFF